MPRLIRRFLEDEFGMTAIEYGVIASLLSVAIIVALRIAGARMSGAFSKISGNL